VEMTCNMFIWVYFLIIICQLEPNYFVYYVVYCTSRLFHKKGHPIFVIFKVHCCFKVGFLFEWWSFSENYAISSVGNFSLTEACCVPVALFYLELSNIKIVDGLCLRVGYGHFQPIRLLFSFVFVNAFKRW